MIAGFLFLLFLIIALLILGGQGYFDGPGDE